MKNKKSLCALISLVAVTPIMPLVNLTSCGNNSGDKPEPPKPQMFTVTISVEGDGKIIPIAGNKISVPSGTKLSKLHKDIHPVGNPGSIFDGYYKGDEPLNYDDEDSYIVESDVSIKVKFVKVFNCKFHVLDDKGGTIEGQTQFENVKKGIIFRDLVDKLNVKADNGWHISGYFTKNGEQLSQPIPLDEKYEPSASSVDIYVKISALTIEVETLGDGSVEKTSSNADNIKFLDVPSGTTLKTITDQLTATSGSSSTFDGYRLDPKVPIPESDYDKTKFEYKGSETITLYACFGVNKIVVDNLEYSLNYEERTAKLLGFDPELTDDEKKAITEVDIKNELECTDPITGVKNKFIVNSMNAGIFEGNGNIRTIKGGMNITAIPKDSFYNCTNLTSVDFINPKADKPNTALVSIGVTAFWLCKKLTDIALINCPNLVEIGSKAFSQCENLNWHFKNDDASKGEIFPEKFMHCTEYGYEYPKERVFGIAKLPETITWTAKQFPNYFLEGAKDLKYLRWVCTGSDKPNMINDNAFQSCHNFVGVKDKDGKIENFFTIPSTVTYIGYYAFQHCENLEINFDGNNKTKYTIEQDAFSASKSSNATVKFKDNKISFGTGIVKIGYKSFRFNTNKFSVTFPEACTNNLRIIKEAFKGSGLEGDVVLPNKTTEIQEETFAACKGLKSLSIPGTCINLGTTNKDTGAQKVHIVDGCSSLETIDVTRVSKDAGGVPSGWRTDAWSGTSNWPSSGVIKVDKSCEGKDAGTQWIDYFKTVIPNFDQNDQNKWHIVWTE